MSATSVFIADDHAIVRDGLKLLLEEQPDIRVVGIAADGREALRQIKKLNPDIALLDITMPELNGIETAQYISESHLDTRVIMLSMHTGTEKLFRSMKAGAKGYILKESASQEVVEAIRIVHAGGLFFSDAISEQIIDSYVSHEENKGEEKNVQSILSQREWEVLGLIVEGKSSIEIGKTLQLSPKTINTYRYRMMEKLDIFDIPGLVKFAIQNEMSLLQ
jgi:DNA-binding NarL/FixJ family response regulator